MATPFKLVRVPSLKTTADFRAHLATLGLDLKLDDEIISGDASPLLKTVTWGKRTIGNRWAIHPMEGWDGTTTGGVTEPMIRRWHRFGLSGAKLIWGGEAMAVRPDGRANPNQLIINEENKAGIAKLRQTLIDAHREKFGRTDDLVIGFQLTHSGRFCRPHSKSWESRIAYRHPILDAKFNVKSDDQIVDRRPTSRNWSAITRTPRRSPPRSARTSSTSSIATVTCCTSSSAPAPGRENTAAVLRTARACCGRLSRPFARSRPSSALACA